MKKVLVFLLTLGLAAGAFAVDLGNGLTVTGEIKTGLKVLTKDDGIESTEDTRAFGYNQDAGDVMRNRLTFGYTGDWGGAKLRLSALGSANLAPALDFAYGWANFVGSKLVVYGGKIDGNLWGTGNLSVKVIDKGVDALNGVRFEIKPVAGLSVGFGLPFDPINYYRYDAGGKQTTTWVDENENEAVDSGESTTETSDPTWVTRIANSGRTIGNVFGGAVIGGLYKSDLFNVAATVRLYPTIDSKVYGGDPKVVGDKEFYGEFEGYADILGGLEVHPIDPLKVSLEVWHDTRKFNENKKDNIQGNKIGFTNIALKGQYGIGAITAHLQGSLFLQNNSAEQGDGKADKPNKNAYYIDKKVVTQADNYVQKDLLVGAPGDAALKFRIGGEYKISDALSAYLQFGSENLLWIAGDIDAKKSIDKPGAGLYVKPGVKIAIGGGNIEIFDKIDRIGAKDSETLNKKDSTKVDKTSLVTNQLQIEFVWSF
jgi:hypothetical protein